MAKSIYKAKKPKIRTLKTIGHKVDDNVAKRRVKEIQKEALPRVNNLFSANPYSLCIMTYQDDISYVGNVKKDSSIPCEAKPGEYGLYICAECKYDELPIWFGNYDKYLEDDMKTYLFFPYMWSFDRST